MLQDLGHVVLRPDGDEQSLRILQLTDLHLFPPDCTKWEYDGNAVLLGEGTDYSVSSTLDLAQEIVNRVKPQLCILTGDVVDGRPFKLQSRDSWRAALLPLIQILVDSGCKFSFCPGNHDDDESPWCRADLLEIFSLPGCISRGAQSFDHTLVVRSTEKSVPVRLLILDSGGNDITYRYGTFSDGVVQGCQKFLSEDRHRQKTLCFFHIPLPEIVGLSPLVGSHHLLDAVVQARKLPLAKHCAALLLRLLGLGSLIHGTSLRNSGLFEILSRFHYIHAAFFGHDHHSDAIYKRKNLYMCYGRVGSTTPPSNWEGKAKLPFAPGARVIEVSADGKDIQTWIETCSGEEAGSRFTLAELGGNGRVSTRTALKKLFLWTALGAAFVLLIRRRRALVASMSFKK